MSVTKLASYSIFVKFRSSRLTLRRGILRREEALEIARELRANRFHDPGSVFVVKEPEGAILDEAELSREAAAPRPAPPLTAAADGAASGLTRRAPPARRQRRTAAARLHGRNVALVVAARERVRQYVGVAERARVADERLAGALAALERLLSSGTHAPAEVAVAHARTRAVHEQTRSMARTLDELATRIAGHVERSWLDLISPRAHHAERANDDPHPDDEAPRASAGWIGADVRTLVEVGLETTGAPGGLRDRPAGPAGTPAVLSRAAIAMGGSRSAEGRAAPMAAASVAESRENRGARAPTAPETLPALARRV